VDSKQARAVTGSQLTGSRARINNAALHQQTDADAYRGGLNSGDEVSWWSPAGQPRTPQWFVALPAGV